MNSVHIHRDMLSLLRLQLGSMKARKRPFLQMQSLFSQFL